MQARRTRRVLAVVAIAASTLALGVAATPAADPNAFGPAYKYCKSFQAEYRIHVYAKRVTCRRARQIQREYWLGPRSRKIIRNGGSGANGYVLLKRFPGWGCGSGAGGGACTKGKASAAYQN